MKLNRIQISFFNRVLSYVLNLCVMSRIIVVTNNMFKSMSISSPPECLQGHFGRIPVYVTQGKRAFSEVILYSLIASHLSTRPAQAPMPPAL